MLDSLQFASTLALNAGNLLQAYYDPAGFHATQKKDRTVVTEADLAADKMITDAIRENFPSDEIISEESTHTLATTGSSVWIIDPLDGTTNFSLGLSIWGVSIARIVDGYPDVGVLYFPMIRELYTCKRGQGSSLNHKSIFTKAPDSEKSMSFFACCSRSYRYYNISIPYKPRIMGSGSYSFCMVARGSALLGLDAAPKIWDIAAAWLLVEEAGGTIAPLEGSTPFPLIAGTDYEQRSIPILAAATPKIYSYGKNKIQRKSKFALTILKRD